MPESKITTGSPELAKERKLIRDILRELRLKLLIPYKFRRIEERFGGHKDGYRANYILIESRKKDRMFQELNISFETYGSNWENRHNPDRVVVRIWGIARILITDPRRRVLERTAWGGDNEITFDRERPRSIQANAIFKLLDSQKVRFDEARATLLRDAARWDAFAKTVKRVRQALKIRSIWEPARGSEYGVELVIPGEKHRKALITIDVFGNIKIKIDDLAEQKLLKVVNAFR